MRVFLTVAAMGSVVAGGIVAAAAGLAMTSSAIAVAAELPSYEVNSLPISPAQVQILGAAGVQERAGATNLTQAGMPASPVQITVLTPRRQLVANAR